MVVTAVGGQKAHLGNTSCKDWSWPDWALTGPTVGGDRDSTPGPGRDSREAAGRVIRCTRTAGLVEGGPRR